MSIFPITGFFAFHCARRALLAADPNSEVVMLEQFDQQEWHDSGCLMFGQDGYLYFGVGDEGGANDQYNVTQVMNQRLMSGVFRIDVNQNPGNELNSPDSQAAFSSSQHPGGVGRKAFPAPTITYQMTIRL